MNSRDPSQPYFSMILINTLILDLDYLVLLLKNSTWQGSSAGGKWATCSPHGFKLQPPDSWSRCVSPHYHYSSCCLHWSHWAPPSSTFYFQPSFLGTEPNGKVQPREPGAGGLRDTAQCRSAAWRGIKGPHNTVCKVLGCWHNTVGGVPILVVAGCPSGCPPWQEGIQEVRGCPCGMQPREHVVCTVSGWRAWSPWPLRSWRALSQISNMYI